MCVIFYQTKKDDLFTLEEFKNAAKTNPHGMGWMANINGKIFYKKGYFNVNEFYNDYVTLKNNPKLVDIAMHFRIGTGSAIDVANCHPFPITSSKKRIKKSKGTCDVAIMMNGIIGSSTNEFSDTALYTMNQLKKYYSQDSRFFLHFNKVQKKLFDNEISGCRFVFMSKDGSKLFGYGWSDYEGKAKVSNRHWIPKPIYNPYYPYSFDDYDTEDWWTPRRAKRFSTKTDEKQHQSYIDYLMQGVN